MPDLYLQKSQDFHTRNRQCYIGININICLREWTSGLVFPFSPNKLSDIISKGVPGYGCSL